MEKSTRYRMKIQILTIFPGICEAVLGESILGRARKAGLVDTSAVDLRSWAVGRHRSTDDAPYGGGPGMVMLVKPIYDALQALRQPDSRVILMSPHGAPFRQKTAERLAKESHLVFVCGHYEGIDQRVADHLIDEEISIGDYVLTNGALASLVVTDAVVRLLPGVLGDADSAVSESFSTGKLDHPHYTRPETFQEWTVPPVLLSGDHGAIARWRAAEAERLTREKRPDLLASPTPPPE